jgi:hypothetical protein
MIMLIMSRQYIKIVQILDILNWDILLEFERLLINCQDLDGLNIITGRLSSYEKLFNILTKSSPISLFKFKFAFKNNYKDPLRLFLDNWKDRYPMLLQIDLASHLDWKITDLIKEYKVKGIVKKFDPNLYSYNEFEWIQEKSEKSYF